MQIKKTDIESLKIVAYFTENSHSTIKRCNLIKIHIYKNWILQIFQTSDN